MKTFEGLLELQEIIEEPQGDYEFYMGYHLLPVTKQLIERGTAEFPKGSFYSIEKIDENLTHMILLIK